MTNNKKPTDLDFSDLDAPLPEVSPSALEQDTLEDEFSPEQEQQLIQEIQLERDYGSSPIQTALESGLSSATFGLSDQAVANYGTDETKQAVRERRARNEEAALAGEIAGVAGPALLSGGTSLVAKGASAGARAAAKAGLLTEQALAKAGKQFIKEAGNKTLAQEVLTKMLPKAAGVAVETVPYSAGTLLSENALGNADINAENIMATLGTGALFGAGLSGAGSLAGKGLTKLKDSAALQKVKTKLGTFVDPEDAAIQLSGFTRKELEKARKINPDLGKDLLDYYKTDLKLAALDSPEKLAFKNAQIKEQSGKAIDNIIDELSKSPASNVSGEKLFLDVAQKIDSQLVQPFKDVPGFESMIKPANKMLNEYLDLAAKKGSVGVKQVQKLRKDMDELAYKLRKTLDPTKAQEAATAARQVLRGAIDDIALKVSPDAAQALKAANKQYHLASTIDKPLNRQLDNKTLLSFKDMLLGSVGAGIGGEEGLLLAGGAKLLQSNLKHRMVMLSAIDKANKKVASTVTNSLNKFLSPLKSAYIPVSSKILAESNLTKKQDNDKLSKPKNSQEAAQNLRENVNRLINEPEFLERKIMAKFYALQGAAPETAAAALMTTNKALQFLKEKMPSLGAGSNTIYGKRSSISDFELGKIARYVQTIEDPLSALKELESGTLTREHVEALKAVYPKIYADIVQKTMQLVESKPDMSYQKKIQLGILLDINTDETLTPEFVLSRQAQYLPKPEQEGTGEGQQGMVKPTQTGLQALSFNNRYMSASEDLINSEE